MAVVHWELRRGKLLGTKKQLIILTHYGLIIKYQGSVYIFVKLEGKKI